MRDLFVRCPFHGDGQEHTPSLSILLQDRGSLKAGFAHCFACGWSGSFTRVEEALGYTLDIPDNIRAATDRRSTSSTPTRLELNCHREAPTGIKKADVPYKFSPYLKSRGIGEVIQRFNKTMEKAGKIYMPFFNLYGTLMGHIERSTDTKWFQVQGLLQEPIGIEEISPKDFLYVTEGQIDKMSMEEMGFHAIALGTVSNYRLLEKVRNLNLALALDNDDAGRRGVELIKSLLPNRSLYSVTLPEGIKDVNELLQKNRSNAKDWVLSNTRRV